MPKRIVALNEYISACDAAELLSEKFGRLISARYVRKLSLRKKNPVQTKEMGNRLLYNKADIEAVVIRKRKQADE